MKNKLRKKKEGKETESVKDSFNLKEMSTQRSQKFTIDNLLQPRINRKLVFDDDSRKISSTQFFNHKIINTGE
jgi:hypothetical protein